MQNRGYMVEFDLPEGLFTAEFAKTIPANNAAIDELMQEGKILSCSMSADQRRLWMIALGHSEEEVMDIVSQIPLGSLFFPNISAMAFHKGRIERVLPELSLN